MDNVSKVIVYFACIFILCKFEFLLFWAWCVVFVANCVLATDSWYHVFVMIWIILGMVYTFASNGKPYSTFRYIDKYTAI